MQRLYSQRLLVHELKFPYKDIIFQGCKIFYPTPGCSTGKMFANVSKIIRNWFLTLQPDIFTIIYNLPKCVQERAWM